MRQRKPPPPSRDHRQLRHTAGGRQQRGERETQKGPRAVSRASSVKRKTKRGRRSMRKRGHAGSGQLRKTTHQSPPARPEHFAMRRVPLLAPPPPATSRLLLLRDGTMAGFEKEQDQQGRAGQALAGGDVSVRRNVTSGLQVKSGRCSQTRLGLPIDDWARFYRPQPGQDGAS